MVVTRRCRTVVKRYRETESIPIGSSVRKYFEGHGFHNGKVVSFDSKSELYKVEYEDGDLEDYNWDELVDILTSTEPDATKEKQTPAKEETEVLSNTLHMPTLSSSSTPPKGTRTRAAAVVTPTLTQPTAVEKPRTPAKQQVTDDSDSDDDLPIAQLVRKTKNINTNDHALSLKEGTMPSTTLGSSREENLQAGKQKQFEGKLIGSKDNKVTPCKSTLKNGEELIPDENNGCLPLEDDDDLPIMHLVRKIQEGKGLTSVKASSLEAEQEPSTTSGDFHKEDSEETEERPAEKSPIGIASKTVTPSKTTLDKKEELVPDETSMSKQEKDLSIDDNHATLEEKTSLQFSSIKKEPVKEEPSCTSGDSLVDNQEGNQQAQEEATGDEGRKVTRSKKTLEEEEEFVPDCMSVDDEDENLSPEDAVMEENMSLVTQSTTPARPKRQAAPVTPTPVKNDKVPKGHANEEFDTLAGTKASANAKQTPKKKRRTKSSPKQAMKKPSVGTQTKEIQSGRSTHKWGLPRGALAQCPTSGFMIRALESIPPNPKQCSPSSLLPGRFMVLARDERGICPTAFVRREFASADALHTSIVEHNARSSTSSHKEVRSLATYEMEAVSDPTFASWEFAMDRLASTTTRVGTEADNKSKQCVLQLVIDWDGDSQVTATVGSWKQQQQNRGGPKNSDLLWAFLEGDQLREIPPVVLGAPRNLVESWCHNHDNDLVNSNNEQKDSLGNTTGGNETYALQAQHDLVPQPANQAAARIKLAASLLEKSIRRGKKLSSLTPLFEAATELIHPSKSSAGSTFAFLKTVWSCMLVDVSPFAQSSDNCQGLGEILLLSLVARADPNWVIPKPLLRSVLATALRTSQCNQTQQWIGFVEPDDDWFWLENETLNASAEQKRAANLRNILRVTQAVAGGRIKWGKWNKFMGDPSAAALLAYLNHKAWNGSHLPAAPKADPKEVSLLDNWEKGLPPTIPTEPALESLDEECRLAAIEPSVIPQTLVLLQAVLEKPPRHWKKHGLPSLSRQVRKLISDANPRFREKMQLARLATWGKDRAVAAASPLDQALLQGEEKSYKSYKEVVTPTATLSQGELDVVDCFESIQRWQLNRLQGKTQTRVSASMLSSPVDIQAPASCHITAGPPSSEYDGRISFVLAFGQAIEVKACGEVVSAMFCGTAEEPLLVQRIGKARKEGQELATAGGSSSGATAVPSLGYVQRRRSEEEAKLMEEAEIAVARHWEQGISAPLPMPPAGFQWDIPGNDDVFVGWGQEAQKVTRTAKFCSDPAGAKCWQFSVGGTQVAPFDARAVISPCALSIDDNEHPPTRLEPGSCLDQCLRTALYAVHENSNTDQRLPQGEVVLHAMAELHNLAATQRQVAPHEGLVYDWLPIAQQSLLPARVWRDALLAIRTRDSDHVVLGKGIQSDGNGAPRDMTEGVLVRIFHALECLYPMALRKEGALRFQLRPRGAAFYHMLKALEKLGRGEVEAQVTLAQNQTITSAETKTKGLSIITSSIKNTAKVPAPSKRPRRKAAREAAQNFSSSGNEGVVAVGAQDSDSFILTDTKDETMQDADDRAVTKSGEALLPLPKVTTKLWPHQALSSQTVVAGVKAGRRGHADASAVGAGKTLTALSTIVQLSEWIQESGQTRHGVLVMLPTKALIREWLLEIATHTTGFHVIEQREDGTLFSLTYGKTNPPIDGNSLIITTLDRVCKHPFVRALGWDFVVIDECLSVQNADAKRVPSAWRQIEVSTCGVLMLSATFFRSKYDSLFYMVRMLRSPLPRTMEWLPATIHEHIVCQIPDTGRTWKMKGEMVPLKSDDLARYRRIIEAFQRKQINDKGQVDGRKLWVDLESFLRTKYEGRTAQTYYGPSSVMGDAFAKVAKAVLSKKRRPLVFADTRPEAEFLLQALNSSGLDAQMWESIAAKNIRGISSSKSNKTVVVAVKSTEGQGINMQKHADTIICRPTPGDHLEQMKGRVDRPGQSAKELHLHVVVCEHSIEEAKFANIRLAGNFFRQYIAPVAARYRERIDLEATLAVGGKGKLKRGTVSGTWKRSLEAAGQSGAFASADTSSPSSNEVEVEDLAASTNAETWNEQEELSPMDEDKKAQPKYKPLNKVVRNKGDPEAVRQAKAAARKGGVSMSVHGWLFGGRKKTNKKSGQPGKKELAMNSPLRFSNLKPATVLNPETIREAVIHLTKNDPKMAALIARVGPDALIKDVGRARPPTQARLFDRCIRAITFTMVSIDAGNAFLRRLAMKVGVCLESMEADRRDNIMAGFVKDLKDAGVRLGSKSKDQLLDALLRGDHRSVSFTPGIVGELVQQCEILNGKRSGYPHLCGVTFPCGKNDDPAVFLQKARDHAKGSKSPVSAGYSNSKASFIVALVDDFAKGKISGEKIAQASDREAAKMLTELKGIGDWCTAQILMNFLSRGDILMYGDLTVRNYLNDLYDINHLDSAETLVESAADFDDNTTNRNLIDAVAKKNGWAPYRSVVCYLMYHLQEENLVLL